MRTTTLGAAATVALLLAAAPAAQAHLTVVPARAPAGGFIRLDVRVPSERDNASTTKVDIKLPPGFAEAAYQPVPGWAVKVRKQKLAKPVQTDDGPVTEEVSRITWTARDAASGIPPDGFQDFGLSVQIPDKPGSDLTFKGLQTYSDGKIVRWIGGEGTDTPAPTVAVVKPGGSAAPAATATPAPPAAASTSPHGGSTDTLSIVAVVLGALALAGALIALAGTRDGGRRRLGPLGGRHAKA